MNSFNELIKNYEKIREYIRDFHVYGYKCRNDYSSKSGRSYDNEKRRIESYLSNYVQYEYSSRGKQLFITADTIDIEKNPLFDTWMTKTFTRNDVILHFIILDILKTHQELAINEIADIIVDEYLSYYETTKIPDNMTIRNKLNEYVELGFLNSRKKGRTMYYAVSKQKLGEVPVDIISKLTVACGYYQNVIPIGVLGHFIRLQFNKPILDIPIFSFRHIYLADTLDDEVLLNIFLAIEESKIIEFDSISKRNNTKIHNRAIPIKVLINVSTGRRYLVSYNTKKHMYSTYRLDYIVNVNIANKINNINEHTDKVNNLLQNSYGITFSNKLERLELTIHIDEEKEDYIHKRILREGKHGNIEKISNNIYEYTIEVADANEMIPWLRTFIGRIISFKCSNKTIESKFIEDINEMYTMYGG